MTALQDRARRLAEKLTEGEWDGPSPDDIAAAMASLARDFAREAIAYYQRKTDLGDRGKADPIDWYLASAVVGCVAVEAAIAAAEKGATDE